MQNVGKWLQAAREAKGVSLEDAESAIRIRTRYLQALEMGDYQAMPGGESQARGFLRRYAAFLDLPPDEAITRYEQEVHGQTAAVEPAAPPPDAVTPASPMDINPPRWGVWQVAAAAGLVVLLVLGGWWLLSSLGALPSAEPTPTQTAATGVSPITPAQPAESTSSPEPEVTPTFPVAASSGVTLTLEPLEHVWVRVNIDGLIAFEGLLAPGSTQSWTAEEMVVVETGNGAGIIAVVNGQIQGPIGGRAEVCARGWGPEGEIAVP